MRFRTPEWLDSARSRYDQGHRHLTCVPLSVFCSGRERLSKSEDKMDVLDPWKKAFSMRATRCVSVPAFRRYGHLPTAPLLVLKTFGQFCRRGREVLNDFPKISDENAVFVWNTKDKATKWGALR